MTSKKIRVAGIPGLAALAGIVTAGTLVLVAPSAPAEQSGGAFADNTSVASGSAVAEDHSVASGNAVAKHGSVASGCSTAIDKSTASGADCAPKKVEQPPEVVERPQPRVVTPVATPRRAVARFAG